MPPSSSTDTGGLDLGALGNAPGSGHRVGLGYWWILCRLLVGILVVCCVSLIVFLATQVLPGSPARAIYGKNATPAMIAALDKQFGLTRPLPAQYLSWLGHLVRGNLGTSIALRAPISTVLPERLENSLILLVLSFAIALPLSIALGAYTAMRRDRHFDRATLGTGLVLTAMPDFVIGLLLVMLLGTTVFRVLPSVAVFPPGALPLAYPSQLALPVLTLVLVIVPYLYRLVRASMIDVLESDYVQMARLKGMPSGLVMRRHALPNALIPVIQATGVLLGVVLAGTVMVEYIFNYPGLGSLLLNAIDNRDLQMIQAVVLVYATGVVLFNLLADVMTVLVTPRLRTSGL
jgi:peptide/nickel transport system permease protein